MATAEGLLRDDTEEATTSEAGHAPVDLGLQLRLMLGRRLIVGLVAPPGGGDEAFTSLAARLAAYPEVTSLVLTPRSTRSEESGRIVLEAARVAADAVLVTLASGSPTTQLEDSASVPSLKWPRDVLHAAERVGLRERAFWGLIGEEMTRTAARRLGFEDGFAVAIAAHDLVARLAQEAWRREEWRRHGSVPPCDR
jgi:hypothetical protein